MLGDAGVAYRLHALGPNALDPYLINLEDKIKLASVTRAWMSDTYGGNRQAGCPEIDTKKFKHGIDNFWYMTYEFNANAPRKPGAPGLMFGCWGDEQRVYRNQRVIMRTKQPWWTPMGIYESVPSNPLSQEEWSAQSPSVSSFLSLPCLIQLRFGSFKYHSSRTIGQNSSHLKYGVPRCVCGLGFEIASAENQQRRNVRVLDKQGYIRKFHQISSRRHLL